jgi:hypothetical protein
VIGVAAVLPKVTVSADVKFVPLMFTGVPGGPELGETLEIVGVPFDEELYVKFALEVLDSLFTWTTTLTMPATWAGVTA